MQTATHTAGTRYYVQRNRDRLLHVQVVVGGLTGQHFVCDAVGFTRWKRGVPAGAVLWTRKRSADCDCGLHAGEYRDAFGQVDTTEVA